eukprot:GHVN01015537.1.p1 GENE.GHVN01015537.1~~GHVN01015537.1.p1  ORF type:complete len:654 (+),score=143.46 GHVN01015537.1:563-2524(+)
MGAEKHKEVDRTRESRLYNSPSFIAGWPSPLQIHVDPLPLTLPQELITFTPDHDTVYRTFFKGTPKEVSIRQLFLHQPLTELEQSWFKAWRVYCIQEKFVTPPLLEPVMLRLLLFNHRKFPTEYLFKTMEHAKLMTTWRKQTFPVSDIEPELRADLDCGIMYWVARDSQYRPLLLINLKRLPKNTTSERFKRLTVFCFEWSLRYLMFPGKVECCTVVLDVRGVSLTSFPVSVLTDMTTTLTKQYPFRLNKMFIINDSWFIQTAWGVAKGFLTEVQQQKMQFYKSGFEAELLKDYAPHQLEKNYGGTRNPITKWYPFPLCGGPFTPGHKGGENTKAIQNCHKVNDEVSARGVVWEGDCTDPVPHTDHIYPVCKALGVPVPGGAPEKAKEKPKPVQQKKPTTTAKPTPAPDPPPPEQANEPPGETVIPPPPPPQPVQHTASAETTSTEHQSNALDDTDQQKHIEDKSPLTEDPPPTSSPHQPITVKEEKSTTPTTESKPNNDRTLMSSQPQTIANNASQSRLAVKEEEEGGLILFESEAPPDRHYSHQSTSKGIAQLVRSPQRDPTLSSASPQPPEAYSSCSRMTQGSQMSQPVSQSVSGVYPSQTIRYSHSIAASQLETDGTRGADDLMLLEDDDRGGHAGCGRGGCKGLCVVQ